jgi:YfiH family protein
MPFLHTELLRYYQFESLRDPGITHAVFTRRGGVSPIPWDSLNFGSTVGDVLENVRENHQRAFRAVGCDPASIYDAWQVHSTNVVIARAPRGEQAHIRGDILLCNRSGVSLFMRFADCVPILLYDPVQRAIGLAHAGWVGTVHHAARVAVQAMQVEYGSSPGDVTAALGPSICREHYPIGADVVQQVRAAFPRSSGNHLRVYDGQAHLDLLSANVEILTHCGVRTIERSDLCTVCSREDWFSHRASGGVTGRFGVLLALCKAGR